MPERFTISFSTNGTGFCFRASGLHPLMVTGVAICLAAHNTSFRCRASGLHPLVAERFTIGFSAYTTSPGCSAGSLLPFVIVERYYAAGTEKNAEQDEIENVPKEL